MVPLRQRFRDSLLEGEEKDALPLPIHHPPSSPFLSYVLSLSSFNSLRASYSSDTILTLFSPRSLPSFNSKQPPPSSLPFPPPPPSKTMADHEDLVSSF